MTFGRLRASAARPYRVRGKPVNVGAACGRPLGKPVWGWGSRVFQKFFPTAGVQSTPLQDTDQFGGAGDDLRPPAGERSSPLQGADQQNGDVGNDLRSFRRRAKRAPTGYGRTMQAVGYYLGADRAGADSTHFARCMSATITLLYYSISCNNCK